MREIKFRALYKSLNQMEYINDLYWFEENGVHSNNDYDYEIMQYTGLKDSTGKEIYEGDIITSNYHNDVYDYGFELTSLVEFRNGCFWLNVHNCELHYYNEFCIVIGNIYENPELLEVKND